MPDTPAPNQPLKDGEPSPLSFKPTLEQMRNHLLSCGFDEWRLNSFRKDSIEISFLERTYYEKTYNQGDVKISIFDPVSALELTFGNDPESNDMGVLIAT